MKLSLLQRNPGRILILSSAILATLSACGGGDGPTDGGSSLPPPVVGTSAECFNPDLPRAGASAQLGYAISIAGSPVGSSSETVSVSDGASFNGGNNLLRERIRTVTTFGANTSEQIEDAFVRWEASAAGPVANDYGSIIEETQNGVTTTFELRFSPIARFLEFTLAEGESYTYTANGSLTTTVNGQTTTGDSEYSEVVTYLGQERVTVLAGDFTACVFRYVDLISNETGVRYFAKGSGVPILFTGFDDNGNPGRSELRPGGTINGLPIVAQ